MGEGVRAVQESLWDVLDGHIVSSCFVEEVARKVTVALVQPRRVGPVINNNIDVEFVVYVNLHQTLVFTVFRVFVFGDFVGLYPRFAKKNRHETLH